jgi:hypothetical protein
MHASAVPIVFAPHSWRIVFVADDLNCHYAGRARVAKALAWMLSLTLPRRAERQDRERIPLCGRTDFSYWALWVLLLG